MHQFITLARAKPRSIAYGADVGSAGHMAMEMVGEAAGTRQHHVPYKGVAPIVTALISGDVQSAFLVIPLVKPHLANGRMRAIGVSWGSRSNVLPDVPTFQEQGLTGFEALQWHGFFVPARTPTPIVDRLNTAIQGALTAQQLNDRAASEGAEIMRITITSFFVQEVARYGAIAKRAGISVQ